LLGRYYADLELSDLEPPVGTERLEEFLEFQWGARAPRTLNKNLSTLRDLFRFQVLRGKKHGDPTLPIERAKNHGVHREVFSSDERRAISTANPGQPDITALPLLLSYGVRKGTLQKAQFRHFDFARRRLTTFVKGEKVQTLPIPDPAFSAELDIYMRQAGARPSDYLLCRQSTHPTKFDPVTRKVVEHRVRRFPTEPIGAPRPAFLVVSLPCPGRDHTAGGRVRGADAQGPRHRRSARPRQDRRQPEGRAAALWPP
jgi:site-specific recombinase XerD